MERWTTLEPVKLHGSRVPSTKKAWKSSPPDRYQYIGPLPADIHLLILDFLPVTSFSSYARVSRAFARLTQDERLWRKKCDALGLQKPSISSLLVNLEVQVTGNDSRSHVLPVLEVQDEKDDFGDFSSASFSPNIMSQWNGRETEGSVRSSGFADAYFDISRPISRNVYIHAHALLLILLRRFKAAPHLVLAELFPPPSPSLLEQSKTLSLLSRFLSPTIQPISSWKDLRLILASVVDRFQAGALAAFESADSRADERLMSEAAWASWECWNPSQSGSEWELGRVWAEKLEIFYQHGQWDPLQNFTEEGKLAFEAMDGFMSHVIGALQRYGALAIRVFPPDSSVLLAFSDRLASEVVSEYITPLLTKARGLPLQALFLQAVAASFAQSWRLVDAILELAKSPSASSPGVNEFILTRYQVEDIVFRMFEPHMDEYLDEEIDQVKRAFEIICETWDQKSSSTVAQVDTSPDAQTARFLIFGNPAQVKRTVLASFTDLMLLPVTIVPRTVGAVGAIVHTGSTAAVNGISMLNPARWGAVGTGSGLGYGAPPAKFEEDHDVTRSVLFHSAEEDEEEVSLNEKAIAGTKGALPSPEREPSLDPTDVNAEQNAAKSETFESLQLMLSLDVALEIIHADREALKRVETFKSYPGTYGHRVRETIEEIFILMLQALSERHIAPGFGRATQQMKLYNPNDAGDSDRVAPLLHFFELVHIGDMIQSMVQVYFDKELASYIDRTDFLNPVVREKKRFENVLDECVAAGLNAGTEVLMAQVEHIIQIKTGPREYYPQEGTMMDLQPTVGCREAIACLETHCSLLKGSTNKEVLEVFHQEIGIRLHAIVQKHIKRQIISLEGGFQVIADLNAYHAFVATLRIPLIVIDFANLKMLGHVYIVEDAKDLAQIVRDVTRYGGSFRPEDIYEFIQRRSDWKKIEKTVDKAMYNLSFREDCAVM